MIRALKWVFKWAALATLFLFLVLMWSVACLLSRLAVRPGGAGVRAHGGYQQ